MRRGGAWLHLSCTSLKGWLPLGKDLLLEIPPWWSFPLRTWDLLIWVSNFLPFLYSTFVLRQSFCNRTSVVMPFPSYWSVQLLQSSQPKAWDSQFSGRCVVCPKSSSWGCGFLSNSVWRGLLCASCIETCGNPFCPLHTRLHWSCVPLRKDLYITHYSALLWKERFSFCFWFLTLYVELAELWHWGTLFSGRDGDGLMVGWVILAVQWFYVFSSCISKEHWCALHLKLNQGKNRTLLFASFHPG